MDVACLLLGSLVFILATRWPVFNLEAVTHVDETAASLMAEHQALSANKITLS